jgi:Putative sensor
MTNALTRPLRDRQTYRNLAYLALALPLGLAEFLFLLVGLALTLVLLVTLLGVAVFDRTMGGAFALARLERRLAARLLRAEIPLATPRVAPPGASIWRRLRVCLSCGTTWQRLGYLAAKLPLATITVALAGAALALSALLLASPLYAHGFAALAFAAAGALALPAALHLVNALAGLWARLGAALLPAAA